MNKIGIIGAMEEEVASLLKRYGDSEEKDILQYKYHSFMINDCEVIIVISGIGKVNSAICTQILIDRFKVDYIINTGVAGSISDELEIGDIVFSNATMQHDVDVTSFGYKLGQIPRMGEKYIFKSDQFLLDKAKEVANKKDYKYHIGLIVSGDSFVGSDEKKKWILENFDAACVDMESGAIGHVCSINNVPYLAIRCISDTSDNRASMKYDDFVEIALEKSFEITSNLIEGLV